MEKMTFTDAVAIILADHCGQIVRDDALFVEARRTIGDIAVAAIARRKEILTTDVPRDGVRL